MELGRETSKIFSQMKGVSVLKDWVEEHGGRERQRQGGRVERLGCLGGAHKHGNTFLK